MAVVSKETLKGYFVQGRVPTESNYEDLIDSLGDSSFEEDYINRMEGYLGYNTPIDEHFDGLTLPSGWTLSTDDTHVVSFDSFPSHVRINGGVGTAYLYRSWSDSAHYSASISTLSPNINSIWGIRLEGSAADTYLQYLVRYVSLDPTFELEVVILYRSGTGDTEHETIGGSLFGNPNPLYMDIGITGTRWSSWGANGYLYGIGTPAQVWIPNSGILGLSWTPSRMGLYFQNTSAGYESLYCDFFKW